MTRAVISPTSSVRAQPGVRVDAGALIEACKPGITRLVTMTAAWGFVLAALQRPWSPKELILQGTLTILGTALSAAGANAINQWMEAPRDARMERTRNRPIPSGRADSATILWFGLFCAAAGTTLLLGAGLAPALIALACIVSYTPPTPENLQPTLDALNHLLAQSRFIGSYAQLLVAADSNDEEAQAAASALRPLQTRVNKLAKSFTAWVGSATPEAIAAVDPGHAFPIARVAEAARFLMPPAEESLAADLAQTGGTAWSKLYNDFSSNIAVTIGEETLPMSAARARAYDPDPHTRENAYHAEIAAWKANEIPIAACMNAIKGEANLLAEKRNWPTQLQASLFAANMDQDSLEAMLEAARDSFPHWRRYLRAKAKHLGRQNGLPFHDLFAPVGQDAAWDWEQAKHFVEEGFRSYSDKLADFAARSFAEGWHDVPPRPGKSDGAFCASTKDDESRMLHNFKPSFGSVSTLAHELGHAYHNLCLADRSMLQRRTPMTLAETASIFCETIIKRKALAELGSPQQKQAKLAILEASLQGACQVVVDITSRYLFETDVVQRRKTRELSPRELCESMAQVQRDTYGDGLDPEKLHPYMWAAKPHYYSYGAFYNFPYMFGLLFALGLYRVYQNQPQGFHQRYDSLLSRTGMAMAADLTAEFGIDIRDKSFWAGSLHVLTEDIDQFESLIS